MVSTQSRQLAAIMFVDIKGFTKKMEEDEVEATMMREKLDSGLREFIPFHKGRIIKQMGDGALCLFNSAIEATVDRIGLERHTLSGLAKDIGSAAVLTSLLLLAVIWILVLWR